MTTDINTLVERLRRMSPRLDMMECEDVLQAAEALTAQQKAYLRDTTFLISRIDAECARAERMARDIRYEMSRDSQLLLYPFTARQRINEILDAALEQKEPSR